MKKYKFLFYKLIKSRVANLSGQEKRYYKKAL